MEILVFPTSGIKTEEEDTDAMDRALIISKDTSRGKIKLHFP